MHWTKVAEGWQLSEWLNTHTAAGWEISTNRQHLLKYLPNNVICYHHLSEAKAAAQVAVLYPPTKKRLDIERAAKKEREIREVLDSM